MVSKATTEKGEAMAPHNVKYCERMSRVLIKQSRCQMLPNSIRGAALGFLALTPLSSGFSPRA